MASRKRTETEREADLAEVARLDRRGWSQREIAERMNVSQQQVCYDLKMLRRRYAAAQKPETAAAVEEKRQQFREVRKEAWDAWERSKENREREVKEKISGILGGEASATQKLKAVRTIEGRLPENEYLRTILMTLREEAELDALYPPKKIAPTNPEGTEPWQPISDDERNRIQQAVLADLGLGHPGPRPAARPGDADGPPLAGPQPGDDPGRGGAGPVAAGGPDPVMDEATNLL